MKNLITHISATLLAAGCVMPATPVPGPPPEKIVRVDATATQIFHGSLQWIAENFKSANVVILYQDDTTNTVIGRGSLPNAVCRHEFIGYVPAKTVFVGECLEYLPLDFVIKVEAKDARMRVSMPSATFSQPATGSIPVGESSASQEMMDVYKDEVLGFADEIASYVEIRSVTTDW